MRESSVRKCIEMSSDQWHYNYQSLEQAAAAGVTMSELVENEDIVSAKTWNGFKEIANVYRGSAHDAGYAMVQVRSMYTYIYACACVGTEEDTCDRPYYWECDEFVR